MELLFKMLQAVENIKLDPSVLEPEPVEIGDEKGEKKVQAVAKTMPEGNQSYYSIFFLSYLEDWKTFQSCYNFKNLMERVLFNKKRLQIYYARKFFGLYAKDFSSKYFEISN